MNVVISHGKKRTNEGQVGRSLGRGDPTVQSGMGGGMMYCTGLYRKQLISEKIDSVQDDRLTEAKGARCVR